MKVLVVSQYFPPEVGATQNRLGAFVDGLRARGHWVDVVCEQPNHPQGVFQPGYGHRPVVVERTAAGRTYRVWVATWSHKTSVRRAAFYASFGAAAGAMAAVLPRPDVVFVTSPPLPAAISVGAAAAARRIPFVLDVRDLWPAAAVALGELSNPSILRLFEHAERWLYWHASRVTATTGPFCEHIDTLAESPVSVHVPNGSRDDLLALDATQPETADPFVLGYVGNMGIAQGLRIVFDAAERLDSSAVRFRLVGDGPLAEELRAERDRRGLDAVELYPAVPVRQLAEVLRACHALLIPLRDHELLNQFIPSKLYDAMAVGRPVISAAGRESAALVESTRCGIVVPPEDGAALAAAVERLRADRPSLARMGQAGLHAAPEHLRSRQIERLEEVLRSSAERRPRIHGS